MGTNQRSTVVGVFEDRDQARRAVEELKRMGFRDDQIGVVSHDDDRRDVGDKTTEGTGSYASEGAAIGAATGAGVGALWALGIAAGLLPGIGPVIAGGLFASLLASAAGGAAVAGIAGALIGMGIPESEAQYYEEEFKGGRTIVTVRAERRYDEVEATLRRFGAYNQSNAPTAATRTSTTAAHGIPATREVSATTAGQTVRLHEEQLHAHKESVQAGEVRAHKEVRTEQKNFEVPVEREELVIERHAATGHTGNACDIREGQEVRIPLKEEKVRVEKDVVAKEDVTLGKRKVQDTQRVSGTVRKEELKVEGAADVAAGNPRTDDKSRTPDQRSKSR